MRTEEQVIVKAGTGYIGPLITADLLHNGYPVTVVDTLLYGGDSLFRRYRDAEVLVH